jgi:hypothetical protein
VETEIAHRRVGFTGTFTSNDTSPSAFTLNGTPCG